MVQITGLGMQYATKKLFENSEAYEILETEESQEVYEYAFQNA